MRILLTGAAGQLGRAVGEVATRHEVVPATRPGGVPVAGSVALDLADAASVSQAVRDVAPDWVLHGAAMTDVDGCERDPQAAHRVNALGSQAVAQACARHGARLLAVSTDYVYDGEQGGYVETAATAPLSAYGRSKLEGEQLARAALPETLVARTSVVFGPHKKNFVLWLIGELRAHKPVRIVSDQRVNPTLSHDLAEQCLALMERRAPAGIYHTAGATSLSRLEMAQAIAKEFALDAGLITPIRSSDLTWLAKRPRDATMNTDKVAHFKQPLAFDEALRRLHKMVPA